jgi:hypothetical protein
MKTIYFQIEASEGAVDHEKVIVLVCWESGASGFEAI